MLKKHFEWDLQICNQWKFKYSLKPRIDYQRIDHK